MRTVQADAEADVVRTSIDFAKWTLNVLTIMESVQQIYVLPRQVERAHPNAMTIAPVLLLSLYGDTINQARQGNTSEYVTHV